MSASFRWEIFEASEPTMMEDSSGEIQLEQVEVLNAAVWQVGEPDDKLNLVPIDSGIILEAGESIKGDDAALSNSQGALTSQGADRDITRIIVLSIVAFFGLGILALLINKLASGVVGLIVISVMLCFIMVCINDLAKGKLSTETYVKSVKALLKGLGFEASEQRSKVGKDAS